MSGNKRGGSHLRLIHSCWCYLFSGADRLWATQLCK